MDGKDPKSSYLPEATGKNRTGKVTKSPLDTLLALGAVCDKERTEELAREYKTADKKRRTEIVQEISRDNAALSIKLYSKNGRNRPEDLVSLVFLAHVEALEGYDLSKGTYLTYFAWRLRAEVTGEKENSTESYGLKVSPRKRRQGTILERMEQNVRQRSGEEPTTEHVIEEGAKQGYKLGTYSLEQVDELRQSRLQNVASLDAPLPGAQGENGRSLHHIVEANSPSSYTLALARRLFPRLVALESQMQAYLKQRLSLRQHTIVMRRIIYHHRLSVIGDELSISRERVRQLFEKGLERVLNFLGGLNLLEFERIYETLQQCERILPIEGELTWERLDPDEVSISKEQARPIDEVLSLIEDTLKKAPLKVHRFVKPAYSLPLLSTLRRIEAKQLRRGVVPPRFTLRAVYAALWEEKTPLDPQRLGQYAIMDDPCEILEERLGLSHLYGALAIHELIARGALESNLRVLGPSPESLRLEGPDPFDQEQVTREEKCMRILFLLPNEYVVWCELRKLVEQDRTCSHLPPLGCETSAWTAVLQALLRTEILAVKENGTSIVFVTALKDIAIVEIVDRKPYYLSPTRMLLAREVQANFEPQGMRFKSGIAKQLEDFVLAWLNEREEDPKGFVGSSWLDLRTLGEAGRSAGLVWRLLSEQRYAISVEGFEECELIEETYEERKRRKRADAKQIPAGSRKRSSPFRGYSKKKSFPTPTSTRALLEPPRPQVKVQDGTSMFLLALTAFRKRLRHALARCDRELALLKRVGGE